MVFEEEVFVEEVVEEVFRAWALYEPVWLVFADEEDVFAAVCVEDL